MIELGTTDKALRICASGKVILIELPDFSVGVMLRPDEASDVVARLIEVMNELAAPE